AAVVPMGYTYEDLPSGLQIIGRPWSEPLLIEIAYAYEQATHHRKAPASMPRLAPGARSRGDTRVADLVQAGKIRLAIFEFDYTYLVPPGSKIRSAAEVDKPEIGVAVVEGHASALALERVLQQA